MNAPAHSLEMPTLLFGPQGEVTADTIMFDDADGDLALSVLFSQRDGTAIHHAVTHVMPGLDYRDWLVRHIDIYPLCMAFTFLQARLLGLPIEYCYALVIPEQRALVEHARLAALAVSGTDELISRLVH